jgi:hypothetical protein
MGDAIAANLFMLGFAFQKGYVPLSSASLRKAIEINGVAVKANQPAFEWGRQAAVDLAAVNCAATPSQPIVEPRSLWKDRAQVNDHHAGALVQLRDGAKSSSEYPGRL